MHWVFFCIGNAFILLFDALLTENLLWMESQIVENILKVKKNTHHDYQY